MSAFDALADDARWVAWRNEARGGKLTKIPYAAVGEKAKADDPSTWRIRTEAEQTAAKIINGMGGGVGIELGDLRGDQHLGGFDLDSCLGEDRTLAAWAQPIVSALETYTEISPSGRGLKAFFYCASEDVRPFLELIGVTNPDQWGIKRAVGEDGRDHGPGIELYLAGRYFTVTGDRWPTQPDKIILLDWPALERLAELIPAAHLGKTDSHARGADSSRSASAFRKGAALRRAGKSFEQMVAALRADPETADWVREKGSANNQRELRRIWDKALNGQDTENTTFIEPDFLKLASWLERDIPPPDFILGNVISTTSRVLLVGPTGIGKTNIGMAMSFAAADGLLFLHWRGCGVPRRVLYIDGEMSRRLFKTRLEDAVRRQGSQPATLFALSREDVPEMAPLNTEAGQKFIDAVIDLVGGIDLLMLDNIQCLLFGDMKDEESWQQTLPWVRDLTRRKIGQVWFHHTGLDESHSYGTSTREWQLDTVALMERIEHPDADIAFNLKFTKARERTPDNRSDFEPAIITLVNDQWSSERGGHVRTSVRTGRAVDRALDLLREALTRDGKVPPANAHIPLDVTCVSVDFWKRYFDAGTVYNGPVDNPEKEADAKRKAFARATEKLIGNKVGKWGDNVWLIP